MLRTLLDLFAPWASIARELTALRELYEADLASRKPPVYRLTEKPSKSDTEVFWEEAPRKPTSAIDRLKDVLSSTEEEELGEEEAKI